jgi:hypothetical protein
MSMTKSLLPRPRNPSKRKLQKVPYVELFDGRLQGVVSSGSDPARVYVAFIEARSGGYSCSTNNNRPCGGGGVCGHLQALAENAVEQFGQERVARYLGCADAELRGAGHIISQLGGALCKRDSGQVFARFLDYLRYLGLPSSTAPLPEMAFFVTG